MRFTKPNRVIGLDIGSHSVKAVHMIKSGSRMRIEDVGYALVDRNQVNVDPVAAHANALRDAISRMPDTQCLIVGALPGQTVVIRYPRIKNVSDSEMDRAVEREAGQNIPYDLSEVFLDWSVLEEERDGDNRQHKILLVAAKHEVIDSRVQIADAAEIEYGVLSVDSLALADAAEGCQMFRPGETVALINIGASSASIHFTRDGVSNFIRDVSWGAREMIQAIAKSRKCDYDQAERILYDLENELSHEVTPTPFDDEPVVAALPADDEGDRSTGAASLLDPLDDEVGTIADIDDINDDYSAVAVEAAQPLSQVLSAPVNRLISEIRRSFDYYEHQLYERPVERVILSGGISHLPLIRDAIRGDLAVEHVDVADPSQGAIPVSNRMKSHEFEKHPSQFMVAMGLAIRGAEDL